jgi:hypothetical protein
LSEVIRAMNRNRILSILRAVLPCVAVLSLAACAMSAAPERMIVAQTASGAPFPQPFRQATCVRNISGGEETDPALVSKVGNAEFSQALASSLQNAQLLGVEGSCRYFVDVTLLGLSQPVAGFSMEVVAHANYKVYNTAGKPILLDTETASYTAAFSESYIGAERLMRANEGAIRTATAQFLEKLRGVSSF